ncbi:unnamed protein product [Adineta steineri]|uniref:Tudor domain-containing protein n=1 Tax=Adineta steineri TaxID=433720 RepID=A0A813ULT2_9BILA|nr:unnamed protein product [Adineta steineri]
MNNPKQNFSNLDDEVQDVLNEIKSAHNLLDHFNGDGFMKEEEKKHFQEKKKLLDTYFTCAQKVLYLKRNKKTTSTIQAEENKKKLLTCQKTSCDKSYFYVQILTRDILLIAESSGKLKICEKRKLAVNDISVDMSCIIYHNKDYYRATIISTNGNGYVVKCSDYEYIVQDININDLYCLPEDEIFFSVPLAKKCR